MIAEFTPLAVFGAFGTAVTIFLGGMTVGRKMAGFGASQKLTEAEDQLKSQTTKVAKLEGSLASIRSVLDESTDLWLQPTKGGVEHLNSIRRSIPIVTVCNFKGGVGKTTLTSLLASYFDLHERKRVLLIDFDFQGSLTDTLLAAGDIENLQATSQVLIMGHTSPVDALPRAYPLHPALSRTKLFSCFYGFNKIENRLTMQWVADNEDDVRQNTHRYLSDPTFQEQFDLVLIDAAPRLSLATVNAFCASTHVLVPTILDGMSTQAALNTLRVIGEVREKLNPGLELLGVVPTLVNHRQTLSAREADSLDRMKARMSEYWRWSAPLPQVYQDTWICRREAIAKAAGTDLAFQSDAEVRQMTVALGERIKQGLFGDQREDLGADTAAGGNVASIAVGRRRA
jgi:chromosome partitioning protein